jgi:hypothetical protein
MTAEEARKKTEENKIKQSNLVYTNIMDRISNSMVNSINIDGFDIPEDIISKLRIDHFIVEKKVKNPGFNTYTYKISW